MKSSRLAVLSILALAGCVAAPVPPQTPATTTAGGPQETSGSSEAPLSDDAPPLRIKHIGFDLGYYDPATNRAGDMQFTHAETFDGKIWTDYGEPDPRSPEDPDALNVQVIVLLPLGTKVHAIVDGVVASVSELYSGDYTVHVAASQGSRWMFEMEHVLNVSVVVGDRVTAGQVIAEVSTHGSHNAHGLGLYEIGLLEGRNPPRHWCPFAYLDESIREETERRIVALRQSWEEYRGDASLYDEGSFETPGCVTTRPAKG